MCCWAQRSKGVAHCFVSFGGGPNSIAQQRPEDKHLFSWDPQSKRLQRCTGGTCIVDALLAVFREEDSSRRYAEMLGTLVIPSGQASWQLQWPVASVGWAFRGVTAFTKRRLLPAALCTLTLKHSKEECTVLTAHVLCITLKHCRHNTAWEPHCVGCTGTTLRLMWYALCDTHCDALHCAQTICDTHCAQTLCDTHCDALQAQHCVWD